MLFTFDEKIVCHLGSNFILLIIHALLVFYLNGQCKLI